MSAAPWENDPIVSAPWENDPIVGEEKKPKKRTAGQLAFDALIRPGLDLAGGAVRGAGSIGATLLAPHDMLESLRMRQPLMTANRERRQGMTEGLRSLGADPDSLAFGAGKLATEVAGVAGVGPALGGLAGAAGVAAPVSQALTTAGFRAGGMTGPAGLALRTGAGATTGAASAGLINPEDAGAGALIGGAMPGGVQAAGSAGRFIGNTLRGPQASPELLQGAREAIGAGYVIPPTQVKPSLGNRLLEGFSGKLTTAQNASARNAATTARMVNKAIGLPEDTVLTPEVLKTIRSTAGAAYDDVARAAGTVKLGPAYTARLDGIAKSAQDAAKGFPGSKPSPVIELVESLKTDSASGPAMVAKIKELRAAASDGFRTGNTDLARAQRAAAELLEESLGASLRANGNREALKRFQDARTLIAKTHSVEEAFNPTTGAIDARKLGRQLFKKKPLSGELKTAADFANRFPTAAKPVEQMGSLPQTSPLDWGAALAAFVATGQPVAMASVAARPLARAATLSGPVQRGLLNTPTQSQLTGLLADPAFQQFLLRSAPALGADR